MRRERTNMTPSAMAAVALHLAVFLSAIIVWPYFGKPVQVVNATAVTLVTSQAAPPPPALQAHEEQEAAAPVPTPTPAPPKPPPQPKAEPKPAPPKPAPPQPEPAPTPTPKPAAKPKTESLDLNALSSSLDKSTKSQSKAKTRDSLDLSALTSSLDKSAKPQAQAKGPSRFATALTARNDPGGQQTANLVAGIVSGRIIPRWHLDCGAAGIEDVKVQVKVDLASDGSLVAAHAVSATGPAPLLSAAKSRAELAVGQAAPFNLPRETYGQWRSFTVNFDAKNACNG